VKTLTGGKQVLCEVISDRWGMKTQREVMNMAQAKRKLDPLTVYREYRHRVDERRKPYDERFNAFMMQSGGFRWGDKNGGGNGESWWARTCRR
jgi:hypothetical protein